MTIEEAKIDACKWYALQYGRELDASEQSLVLWGFVCGASWQAKVAFDKIKEIFPEDVPIV